MADDTFYAHRFLMSTLKDQQPKLQIKPYEALPYWQKKARQTLTELLGMRYMHPTAAQINIEYERNQRTYREIRFVLQSEEGYSLPCCLLIPNTSADLYPLALCLQGHSTGMHISMGISRYPHDEEAIAGDRDFAMQAIEHGYAALMVEQRDMGECGGTADGPDCYQEAMTALLLGRTTLGERVWDNMRALDMVARHFNQIDMTRCIGIGNSGGGTTLIYLAALDTRLKAVVLGCSFCRFDQSIMPLYHCACNYVPGIRRYFEMSDMAGMIAPRAMVVVAGSEDPIFPLEGVRQTVEEAKHYYALANHPERLLWVVGAGGHRFYKDIAWQALTTMDF